MLNNRKIAAALSATWTFGNLDFEILNLNSNITPFHKTPHFPRFSLICPFSGMCLPPRPAKKPQRSNPGTFASFTIALDVNHLRSILKLNRDVRNGKRWEQKKHGTAKNYNCPVYSHKLRQKSFIKNYSMKITGKSPTFKTTYIPDYFPSLSGEIFITIAGLFGSYIAEDSSYAS